MTKTLRIKKAFTLTELIVVIAIIGILAAVLIPSLTGYIKKAKESAAKQEAGAVYEVFKAWSMGVDDGSYGKTLLPAATSETDTLLAWSDNKISASFAKYYASGVDATIPPIANDAKSNTPYVVGKVTISNVTATSFEVKTSNGIVVKVDTAVDGVFSIISSITA